MLSRDICKKWYEKESKQKGRKLKIDGRTFLVTKTKGDLLRLFMYRTMKKVDFARIKIIQIYMFKHNSYPLGADKDILIYIYIYIYIYHVKFRVCRILISTTSYGTKYQMNHKDKIGHNEVCRYFLLSLYTTYAVKKCANMVGIILTFKNTSLISPSNFCFSIIGNHTVSAISL